MVSRRNFLRVGGAAVCAGVASTAFGKAGAFQANARILGFSGNRFRPLINSYFQVRSQNSDVSASLKLVEVKDLIQPANHAGSTKPEGFSLLFEGREDLDLKQDIYRLNQQSCGEFSSLVVPVTNERKYYEVIFNHLPA